MTRTSSPRSARPVRIAIVGTGNAANAHVKSFKATPGCTLVAGVDVLPGRAEAFCDRHGIPHAYQDVGRMLAEVPCDAVSIVTSDAFHAPVALTALKAGKHVLCEKPLALNHGQARRMVAAARQAGVVNMVNFSYRSWPALDHLARLVREGTLGELRHVEASYYQSWLPSRIWGDWREKPAFLWRMSSRHGGTGVLGDIGVHILDFATHPVGDLSRLSCILKTFPKAPRNRLGRYHLDANDSALINVEFRNGAIGVVQTTRWATGHENRLYLKVCGTLGTAELDSDLATDRLRVCDGDDIHTGQWRTVKSPAVVPIHRRFVQAIRTGRPAQPDFARGAAIQKILDACFASAAKQQFVRL